MKPVFTTFTTPKGYYVFDRNTNSIISINEEGFIALEEHNRGVDNQSTHEIICKFQSKGYLLPHKVKEIKHYASDNLQHYLDRKIEKTTLQVTQNCNLRCDYCAYSGSYHNRVHANKRMSFATAKKALDYLFAHSCEKQTLSTFRWNV